MDQRGRCRLVFSVFSFFQFFVSGGYEELVNKWSTHSRSSLQYLLCNLNCSSGRFATLEQLAIIDEVTYNGESLSTMAV